MEHIEEDRLVFRISANRLKKMVIVLISTPSDKGGSDVHGEMKNHLLMNMSGMDME